MTIGRRLAWGGLKLDAVAAIGAQVVWLTRTPSTESWKPAETTADETAAILFTSGSTGVPKGAVYSHGNFAAQVAALKQSFQIEPGEIDLCTFPLFALFAPALGMTAVVPRMDFTKPARVDPREIDEPILKFQINNLFGSPALLNRVSRELEPTTDPVATANGLPATFQKPWPSIRRVLSAGAPVSPSILERLSERLTPGTQIFTPYGATESLPVAVIGSHEVLLETRHLTAMGAGTCVGRPVAGIDVQIIRIVDEPVLVWNDELRLPRGETGEIVVHGPMVTQSYYERPELTALAKIRDPSTGRMRHRMGDVGYFDEQGRLWFCGRKAHRVVTRDQVYFTDPVEGVFNTHPAVFRTALVGIRRQGQVEPLLCVERELRAGSSADESLSDELLTQELLTIGARFEHTRAIRTILFHPSFPVDVRHNSKIFREKLAIWANRILR